MHARPASRPNDYIEPLNRQQIRIYRRMTGEQRFRIGFEITDFVTRLALAGIRHRHPEASDAEAQRLLRAIYRTRDRHWSHESTHCPTGAAEAKVTKQMGAA